MLYNRDLILIYISAIAILWNLWFFSFWSVSIVSQAAPQATFLNAALTAALNAGAGILGFPIGGWPIMPNVEDGAARYCSYRLR